MKISSLRVLAILTALFSLALVGRAQNRERFGISAKAGGINAVTGQVKVKREGQAPRLLTSNDDLVSGDVVTTGDDSQTEILLNPGTYLRLAENGEFVLVDNSLDNLLVKLNKGSAIIEATGPEGVEQHIPVVTDQQRFTIVRSGIYRINAATGVTEVFVRKGRILVNSQTLVKGGKKVTITGTGPNLAKLTKYDKDEFDDWSKERGKTLARANQKLSARAINAFLSSSAWSWPGARFGRWGLWTWSPFASCYTFLPFHYGWGSPYGSYYGLYAGFGGYYSDGSCCRPRVYTQPPLISSPTLGGPTPGSGTSTGVVGGPSSPASAGPPSQPRAMEPETRTRSINPENRSGSIHRIKDP